jgi:hypothetical protein
MGFSRESEYKKAFDNAYEKITGGRVPAGSAGTAIFQGTPSARIPAPDVLVRLYTGTMQAGYKKRSGVFYTPPEVVRFMCRESLAHYLSNSLGISFEHALMFPDQMTPGTQAGRDKSTGNAAGAGKGTGTGVNTADMDMDKNISPGLLLEADRALETIRIFDPAAGCGAFICGMLDEIVKLRSGIARHIGDGSAQNGDRSAIYKHPFILKYNAITNSIHGADIDATAVEITRLRLWYELITEFERYRRDAGTTGIMVGDAIAEAAGIMAGDAIAEAAGIMANDAGTSAGNGIASCPGAASPDFGAFRCNIHCADSLFDYDVRHFDVITGNPPYISAVEGSRSGGGTRQALKKKYPQLKGAFDIYAAFLLDGVSRLNEKGVYCWIVPNKLLVSQYAAPVLQYLKENGLRYSISVSHIPVFSGVGVYPVIITGNRCKAGSNAPYCFHEYSAESLQQLDARRFVSKPDIRRYRTFADHNIKIASGAAGFQAMMLKQYIKEAPCAENAALQAGSPESAGCGFIPFAVSGSIDKYRLDRSNVRYMGTTYKNPHIFRGEGIADSKWKLWCGEKICIAGMTRELEAYYSSEPLALGVGTYAIYDFGGMDPLYLLALLNSRFMSWYLREKFYEKHLSGGYLAVNKYVLEQLPLARADKKTEQEIARRAEKLQQILGGTAKGSAYPDRKESAGGQIRSTFDHVSGTDDQILSTVDHASGTDDQIRSTFDHVSGTDSQIRSTVDHISGTDDQIRSAEAKKLLDEIDGLVYSIYGIKCQI